jgi:hypothetical protein
MELNHGRNGIRLGKCGFGDAKAILPLAPGFGVGSIDCAGCVEMDELVEGGRTAASSAAAPRRQG